MFVSLFRRLGFKFLLNDPQWGRGSQDESNRQHQNDGTNNGNKKPNEEPPDLDQLWRNFNRYLTRIFYRHKNNRSSSPNSGNNFSFYNFKGAGISISLIIIITICLWLSSGFFIVQEGQTAVVMTFGKYSHTTLPGFNWCWPYPLQSHEIVNISQVRTAEIGYRGNAKNKQLKESLMLTDDENIIDIQFAVQYTLKNAANWLFNNRDQDETVRQVAETAIREVVGRSKMDFVLYEGREKVALDVNLLMQKILDRYKSGVQVTNVTMQGVQPPEQVQAAFDDAVKAGQDRERQKNEGQAYANNVIPRASGAASRLLEEAEAYRARIIANAEGDTSRFKQVLLEYQKAPIVTRDRMYLETMQQIFSNVTKVLVDAKNGNNLLYLPLDKLMQQIISDDINKSTATTNIPSIKNEPAYSVDVQRNTHNNPDVRNFRDREER